MPAFLLHRHTWRVAAVACALLCSHRVPAQQVSADRPISPLEQERQQLVVADRQKKILEDTRKLVELSQALKAQVDKTGKDELSLEVIRQADQIERLAHQVKEQMKK